MAGEAWVVVLSREGRMKRMPLEAFGMRHRGGKGIMGARAAGEDVMESMALVGAGEDLIAFTNAGRCVGVSWDKVPEMGRYARGANVSSVFPLNPGEKVSAFFGRGTEAAASFLAIVTRRGVVKRTDFAPLLHLRATGVRIITLTDSDEVCAVAPSSGEGEMVLATRRGKAVRFSEGDVRVSGRQAQGVTGIKLGADDEVMSLAMVTEASTLLSITTLGYGKRTQAGLYRKTTRGTMGVTNIGNPQKVGSVVAAFPVGPSDQVILATERGKVARVAVGEIRETGRSASGVRVMRLDAGDQVTAAAPVSGV